MNKQEIKADYTARKKELKLAFRQGKTARKYAYRMRKTELKCQKKITEGEARKEAKKALRLEKREYKKEAYLQKSIYLEKRTALKKERNEALGSLASLVNEVAPDSLAGNLTLSYTLIFLIFAIVQGLFVISTTYYIINRRAEESFLAVAESLEARDLQQELAKTLAEYSDLNVVLFREDGSKVYSFGMEEISDVIPYNAKFGKSYSFRYQTESLRIYAKQIETADGIYYLNLAKSVKVEDALISVVVNLLLIAVAAAGIVIYLVGYRINRKLLRPIRVLGRAMEEMNATNLSERLETKNIRTELVEVVQSYNRMLDKIEEAYERQKQFVSDASHELRTPLAVVSGYSDILSRWGTEDPEVTQEAIEAIVTQTNHMQALLERLLYIARSDNGRIETHLESGPLAPLCGEVLQDFRMMHPDRLFILNGEVSAKYDAGMLRQMLVILLDNAVKFTEPNGRIEIHLFSDRSRACLAVKDNGIGMSPEVSARVFERFYKGDSSHNEKGFGLGLSIARLMTEMQKGTISVESTPYQGTTFTITLPL